MSTLIQGQSAERVACEYLQQQGLSLIERNFRCRLGEIDLIMRHDRQLIFVEVRSRNTHRYGHPAETVTQRKQRRLLRTAMLYLQRHRLDVACRFDIVAIDTSADNTLEWIQDAFQAN